MTKPVFLVLLVTFVAVLSCDSMKAGKNIHSLAADISFIGTKQFTWEDINRVDNYYGGARIINAQVWYPSSLIDSSNLQSPYLLYFDKVYKKINDWSDEDYNSVRNIKTSSFIDAPLNKDFSKAPLLIFSPSLGGNLSYYTYYAEFFAKKGYVVLGVNHLYESEVVIGNDNSVYLSNLSFHDSLKTLNIPEQITADAYRAVKGKRQKILAQDLQFALNQILDEPFFNGRIQENRIGAFGHSTGGAAAVYLSILDKRIKAVINLDGTPPSIALKNGIVPPFLFIEDLNDYHNHQGYAKMHKRRSDFCKLNRADSWRILIGGFNHNSFLDINYYLAENLTTSQKEKENLDLVVNYMNTFLNFYLIKNSDSNLESHNSDKLEIIEYLND